MSIFNITLVELPTPEILGTLQLYELSDEITHMNPSGVVYLDEPVSFMNGMVTGLKVKSDMTV